MVKDTMKPRDNIKGVRPVVSLTTPRQPNSKSKIAKAKSVVKVIPIQKSKAVVQEESSEDENTLNLNEQNNSSDDFDEDEDEGNSLSGDEVDLDMDEDDDDEDDEEDDDDEDEEGEEDSELEFAEEVAHDGEDTSDDDDVDDDEEEEDSDGESDLDLNELGSLNFEEFAEAIDETRVRKKAIGKTTTSNLGPGASSSLGTEINNAVTSQIENSAEGIKRIKAKLRKSKSQKKHQTQPLTSTEESRDEVKDKEILTISKNSDASPLDQEDQTQEINNGSLVRLQERIRNQEQENDKLHPETKSDEYADDSSDEEDIRNTIGNVPLNWYDEYPHVGYDLDGKKLIKPQHGDKLDAFLSRMEDPDFWRTVKDKQTGQNVVLSDQDMNLIRRIQSGNIPDPNFNAFAPWIDWFSSEVMETPLKAVPLSKTSFLPSKIDKMKISKMVHAIKMGWMKPKKKPPTEPQFYMLWDSDDKADAMRRIQDHIPAPKTRLPGNAESYNPPPEYLFDHNELAAWKAVADEPWKRKYNFIPQKYPALRNVPAYNNFIKDRFERCLDLYLCPRAKKMRLTIKAEDLVPQLPNPKDLQPYPTTMSMVYKGHTGMVRSISMEPDGQFFATGSADGSVKIWEIQTGRCLKTFVFQGTVRCVEWCPNKSLALVAVAYENEIAIINPGVGDKLIVEKTDALLLDAPDMGDYVPSDRVAAACTWEPIDEEKRSRNIRLIIKHFKPVRQVTWHGRGDYFSSVMPDGQNRSVIIHQLSTRKSQIPLSRSKGLVQCVAFHPIRPCFFVATQRHIRVYDLSKQQLVKKLVTGQKWISSIAIHPKGDNVIVGGYDKKVTWFDLDLSTKPYQTLRHHGNAVRSVAYHKRYPLFASGSDDCSVIVCHGMVYNDLLQNPLIVPVKKLRGHEKNEFGVLSVTFHNFQPWVFSTGADHTVRLFT